MFTRRFRGSAETTFERYPERLTHLVLQTYPRLRVEHEVYPTYATRGSLENAVDAMAAWLTERVVVREAESTPKRRVGVVLCGHSMGGIVSLDAALAIRRHTPPGTAAWPHILGVLAYDTPFLGGACAGGAG